MGDLSSPRAARAAAPRAARTRGGVGEAAFRAKSEAERIASLNSSSSSTAPPPRAAAAAAEAAAGASSGAAVGRAPRRARQRRRLTTAAAAASSATASNATARKSSRRAAAAASSSFEFVSFRAVGAEARDGRSYSARRPRPWANMDGALDRRCLTVWHPRCRAERSSTRAMWSNRTDPARRALIRLRLAKVTSQRDSAAIRTPGNTHGETRSRAAAVVGRLLSRPPSGGGWLRTSSSSGDDH